MLFENHQYIFRSAKEENFLRSRVALDKMAAMLESVPQAPARQWQSDKMMKSPQVDTILQVGVTQHRPYWAWKRTWAAYNVVFLII